MNESQERLVNENLATFDTVTIGAQNRRSMLTVNSFGLTHPGKIRESNQDHFLIATLNKALRVERTSLPQPEIQQSVDQGHLFIVADGMGGHAGGEVASTLAVDSVETFMMDSFQWFANLNELKSDAVFIDFERALAQANVRLLDEAAERPRLRGMGTTMTLAYSLNDELFVAHVGDSRCYLFRSDILSRLTRDHTLAEELIRRGALTPEECEKHPLRHAITNVIGGDSDRLKVEVHKRQLLPKDGLLLCSDGLTNMVSQEEITDILQSETDPERVCRECVLRANAAGGRDNITVIYVRYG